MGLDIDTKKGEESVEEMNTALDFMEGRTGWEFIRGSQKKGEKGNRAALLDGTINKNKLLRGVYEAKGRKASDKIIKLIKEEGWLIDNDKIKAGRVASRIFGHPFYGILFLKRTREIYFIQITDEFGKLKFPYKVVMRKTRKSCNDPTKVEKEIALLPFMKEGNEKFYKLFRIPEDVYTMPPFEEDEEDIY